MNKAAYRKCFDFHQSRLAAIGQPDFWAQTEAEMQTLYSSFDGDMFSEELLITVYLDIVRHANPQKGERANRLRWLIDRMKEGDV